MTQSREELLLEIEELKARLEEAEEVLRAIRGGEVDAIVVTQNSGDQVALILSPTSATKLLTSTFSGRKNSPFVARSVNVGEVEEVLRGRLEHTARLGADLFLGISPQAEQLSSLLRAASENKSTILLEGETGTGKSMIARWIYEHSDRANSSFVEINCASLKGELLANELFGHERGAYTSATEIQQGLLDVANGGTLFLDEIGDMDISVQSQFLKVLEEKRYRRLGSVVEKHSEFRLICATNRNLTDDIQNGKFRKDLYYRIHVFPILVPPLRERPEDIPGFCKSVLGSFGAREIPIARDAMQHLQDYSWPGNIRELRNVLERALLLSGRKGIRPDHLPGLNVDMESLTEPSLTELERIQAAIKRFHGNKKRAAEFLGISRVTLYRKIKTL